MSECVFIVCLYKASLNKAVSRHEMNTRSYSFNKLNGRKSLFRKA